MQWLVEDMLNKLSRDKIKFRRDEWKIIAP